MWPTLYHSKDNLGERPQGQLTTGVSGLVHTYGGYGDYSSGAWWPTESLQITAPNQVNRSCLHGGRVTIPQLRLYFPCYTLCHAGTS